MSAGDLVLWDEMVDMEGVTLKLLSFLSSSVLLVEGEILELYVNPLLECRFIFFMLYCLRSVLS